MNTKVSLTTSAKNKENYVALKWDNIDKSGKYTYRIFSKKSTEKEFQSIFVGSNVKVLNVYSDKSNSLKELIKNLNLSCKNGYEKGLISVDEVEIDIFNKNAKKYLKDKNDDWKYDVIYISIERSNNRKDLSSKSVEIINEFIEDGRKFISEYHTISSFNPNLCKLDKYVNIDCSADNQKALEDILSYLIQATNNTSWDDYKGQDIDAPKKPAVKLLSYDKKNNTITINYECDDTGTTYYYYIEATNLESKVKINSDIQSATVTAGIKGYLLVVDDKPDTIPVGDITTKLTSYSIPLKNIEYEDVYIHIAAVDNAGNVSEVCHYKGEEKQLTLKVKENNDKNYISLEWENTDKSGRYSYMIYSKRDDENEFQSIPSKSYAKVLNVYPECGDNLKGWMETPNYEDENGYGKGLISVDAVNINDFNSRPEQYLKDNNGNWKYDVIYVGAWDSNNNKDYSQDAINVIEEFIKEGRGFLAGHDFFTQSTVTGLSLAKYEEIIPECVERGYGSDYIRISKKGLLINHPWKIGEIGGILNIPFSHTSQFSYGDVWMKYAENKWSVVEEINEYNGQECTNNFYLSTWNNTAMIQTGHSNGYATPDEQKLLANTLLYLSQVTYDTSWKDYKGQDISSPDKPIVNEIYHNKDNNTLTVSYIPSNKKGTTYSYYVVGTNLDTNEKIKSEIRKVTITSKFKGYMIAVDNNQNTIPSGDAITKHREYTVSLKNVDTSNMYVHVMGMDEVGNMSEVCHYKCGN